MVTFPRLEFRAALEMGLLTKVHKAIQALDVETFACTAEPSTSRTSMAASRRAFDQYSNVSWICDDGFDRAERVVRISHALKEMNDSSVKEFVSVTKLLANHGG